MASSRSAGTGEDPDFAGFACEVVPERETARVRLRGALDMASAGDLEAQVDDLRVAGFRRVILDLRELAFMDSTGLRLVLQLDALARQDGFTLGLVRGPERVHRVFELTRTAELLPFVDE
jgi:anti-anti-sigma factor